MQIERVTVPEFRVGSAQDFTSPRKIKSSHIRIKPYNQEQPIFKDGGNIMRLDSVPYMVD